jgi:hypothetical protein
MEELQDLAVELVGRSKLSGLPPFRFYMPDASSFLRYNRAEGWYAGLGASYVSSPSFRIDALGGYSFGVEHGAGLVQTRVDPGENTRLIATAEVNTARDVGPITGLPGVLNTIAGRLFHDDYLDPYYVDAVTLHLEQRLNRDWQVQLRAGAEDHTIASLTQDATEFRPVHAIDEGRAYVATVGVQRALPITSGLRFAGGVDVDVVNFDDTFTRPRLDLQAQFDNEAKTTSLLLRIRGSTTLSKDVPRQFQVLLGGRETIPGYAYRGFGGNSYALAQFEAARTIWQPWLRVRAVGAAGYTDFSGTQQYERLRPETDGVKFGGGLGVGLFWDILRFDLTRGDDWRVIFSVQPTLRDLL